ncbi:MAG TPA: carboxypeptidase regulatory-like domain-containing protein [Thermoanaerobaculia bacterium]|nr:carboxypeptidase regulatory-like domain-containing protein [Thermoanaerobaculia bacterium]
MKRYTPPRLLAVVAALCISLLAISAFAQFQTGNIYGKVQAKDGSALPGVTVVLTGVGAPQTSISDAQGDFRFIGLSPGTYTLKADLAGYGTSTRAGVSVNIGRNADVTMTLNPSVAESITVTAEAPLLDIRKAGDSTSVSKVELEKIPSGRDPWAVMQTTPSIQVDRINVGGSQSGQQSVYVAKGAQSTDNTWNMDGVNITDMGATGSTPLYFDFDSFEEMQVTTGGSDPRIMTPGVQLNMVTKRGSNDFRGSGRYFYAPGSLQTKANIPSEAVGYLAATNKIDFNREYGGEVGGPIWRDHLWAWVADSEQKISNTGTQRIGQFILPDNIILRDKNAKINAQLLPSNSAVGFYTFGDKGRNARNLSPTRPFPTSWKQSGPTKVDKIEDTQIVGSSLYVTGMWSKVSGGFGLFANGGQGLSAPPAVFDAASGAWAQNFFTYQTDRPQKQYRLDGSKFFDLGSMNHELKFGFGYRDTPVTSSTTWPGPAAGFWELNSVAPSDCTAAGLASTCQIAALTRASAKAYGEKYRDLYAGDTILMGNLTLQAGLRMDRQQSLNLASSAAANPVIGTPITLPCAPGAGLPCTGGTFTGSLSTLTFNGDARKLAWNTVSPRLGLTYALGADKKTLLRAAYNRYVSQMGATVSNASPTGLDSYFYFYGVDANHDNIIQRNELLQFYGSNYIDPLHPNLATSSTRVDYGMKAPKTDEFILGFDRELMSDFSVGMNFTYRHYTDLVGTRYEKTQGAGNYYTRADWVVSTTHPTAGGTFTEPASAGGNVIVLPKVPVYVIAPGVPAPLFAVITNLPGYTQRYEGVELTATKRMSHKWMFRANASWNSYTEQCSAEAFPNPTPYLGNCPGGQVVTRSAGSGAFGNVFINSKWNANITGLYQLPWDANIGASLTARQGYPSVWRDQVRGINGGATYVVGGAPNRQEVILQPVGTTRFDNVYELDLRAAKDIRFMNRVGLTLSADLFNVPNQRTILQRQTRLFTSGASFSQGDNITEMQSPRVWRLGAKFTF